MPCQILLVPRRSGTLANSFLECRPAKMYQQSLHLDLPMLILWTSMPALLLRRSRLQMTGCS